MRELNNAIRHLKLPERMRGLPIESRGYPVPFFVGYVDGKPDFRTMDGRKFDLACEKKLCWMCGQRLGAHFTFAIGPMCAINRVISEPPSHRSCVEYGVRACPFLTNPRMRRNEKNLAGGTVAGEHLDRNPGVTLLWTTHHYIMFWAGNGWLFRLGEPTRLQWFAEGRAATREEILASIDGGLPTLIDSYERNGIIEDFQPALDAALKLVPAA
jgi:hypothetical protein